MNNTILSKAKRVKIAVTDIDGVWTDSCIYYSSQGEEMKKFSVYDGMGVEILRNHNIETAIITSENSAIVSRRAEKLKIKDVILGSKNKINDLEQILKLKKIDLDEVAYIGDDVNDISVLERVGFSVLASNSPIRDSFQADYITGRCGGQGAFREMADIIIQAKK
ncbi:MAG: hypothetical protein CBD58_03480 [bacterium TMED198]|nr:MAG: hypothetical protein CBD58_03480 [bacterium TMED198]